MGTCKRRLKSPMAESGSGNMIAELRYGAPLQGRHLDLSRPVVLGDWGSDLAMARVRIGCIFPIAIN